MSARKTLHDLEMAARLDLSAPTKDAQLRWIFWHAEAVGMHEAARIALDDVNLWDRSVRSMLMQTLSPSLKECWAPERPSPQDLNGARETLIAAAACVHACENVLALLARAGEHLRAKPTPVGHVSQSGPRNGTSKAPPQHLQRPPMGIQPKRSA